MTLSARIFPRISPRDILFLKFPLRVEQESNTLKTVKLDPAGNPDGHGPGALLEKLALDLEEKIFPPA
jgi:hypothetical protein